MTKIKKRKSGRPKKAFIPPKRPDQLGDAPELKKIWLHSLLIDDAYQRALDSAHALSLSRDFMWRLAGALVVSERSDGTYRLVDGQHRAAALRLIYGDENVQVQCMVSKNHGEIEVVRVKEARDFNAIQEGRKNLSLKAKYDAGVSGNNPAWLSVQAAIDGVDRTPFTTAKSARIFNGVAQLIASARAKNTIGGVDGREMTRCIALYADRISGDDTVEEIIVRGTRALLAQCFRHGVDPNQAFNRIGRNKEPLQLIKEAKKLAHRNNTSAKREINFVMRNEAIKNLQPKSKNYIPEFIHR